MIRRYCIESCHTGSCVRHLKVCLDERGMRRCYTKRTKKAKLLHMWRIDRQEEQAKINMYDNNKEHVGFFTVEEADDTARWMDGLSRC